MDKILFSSSLLGKFRFIRFSFLIFFIALLTSCAHVGKKDGPPDFYVDVSRIPDATPKNEPLSKYGNLTSYRVFGRRYYTMRSSKNYEQVGIASWYGTKFHARRTSSGEPYDMLAMTAAHKTLPLPTYVEVTNLRNQRKVIVKVNDRGPFEGNRLIDLSYVAARKLGITAHGTAKVKIKAIDPNTHGQSTWFNFASNNHQYDKIRNAPQPTYHKNSLAVSKVSSALYLQVGSFRNQSRAEKYRRHLMALLKTPVKITKLSSRRQPLYRVQIGPLKNLAAAHKISSHLKRLGFKSNKLINV